MVKITSNNVLKQINLCNIYTVLWCLLALKGVLYDVDMISVAFYGMIMLISLYCFVRVLVQKNTPILLGALNVLVGMFLLYGVVNMFFGEPIRTSWNVIPTDFYLKNILNSLLPIYAYYYFTKNGNINESWLRFVAVIFLIVCIFSYKVSYEKAVIKTGFDEVTNNGGYLFVSMLPIICFWNKRPIIQYVLLIICMLFIVLSMKRGAILVGVSSLLFFLFEILKEVSPKRKFIYLLLSVALFVFCYYFVEDMLNTSTYFERRLQNTLEGNSSSRNSIYLYFLNFMFNRNPFYILFGQGADSTIRNGVNYAHCDWLEIGVNQGLVGVIIFSFFFYRLYKFWRITHPYRVLYIAIGVFSIQIFLKSLFSMSINDMDVYSTCVLGYALGIIQLHSKRCLK